MAVLAQLHWVKAAGQRQCEKQAHVGAGIRCGGDLVVGEDIRAGATIMGGGKLQCGGHLRTDWGVDVQQGVAVGGEWGGGALMALDWSKALRETLLGDVRTLQWYYQDGRSGEWTQEWDASKTGYPARVRVEIADERGAWPSLVFPLARAR